MAAGFLRLDTGATISLKASWAANIPDGTGTSFILGDKAGLRLDPLTLIGTAGRYQADTVLKVPADPDVPLWPLESGGGALCSRAAWRRGVND